MDDFMAEHVANAHREAASSPLLAVQAARKAADAIAHDAFLRRAGRGVPPTSEGIVRALGDRGACSAEVARAFELVFAAATDARSVAPDAGALAPTLTALRTIAGWYWGEVLKVEPPAKVRHLLHPAPSIADEEDENERGGTLVTPKVSREQVQTIVMNARDNVAGHTELAVKRVARPGSPPRPSFVPPPSAPMPPPAPASRLPLIVGGVAAVLVIALVLAIALM